MSLSDEKKLVSDDGSSSSPSHLPPGVLSRHIVSVDAMRTTCEAKSFLVQLVLLCLISTALSLTLPAGFADQQARLLAIRATTTTSTPVTDLVPTIKDRTDLDPMATLLEPFGHESPQSYPGGLTDSSENTADAKIADSLATSSANGSMQAGGYHIAFEINRPPRVLPDVEHLKSCTVTLLTHRFENSYGHPAVTHYSPNSLDAQCRDPTKWIFIVMGVSGSGKGRQYDRLGSVQLDGIEVLRTDNQEPHSEGSRWRFAKEMNKYYDVFRTDRTLMFDLPNIVNQNYTSPLDYSLDFTVYISDGQATRPPLSASFPVVLPLSKRQFNSNSFFSIGQSPGSQPSGSTRLNFPTNARAALVEIYASGTAKDEFWYTNLPNEAFQQDGGQASDYAYGDGPLRELQVIIDGRLAGIAQPYPVIFTGGISPYLWRPSVAYGAFDQPTYYVDISPFIGQLTDGQQHDFTLTVVSAEKDQHVLSWFVSGNVQVMLDTSNARTTGSITSYNAPKAGTYSNGAIVSGNVSRDGMISAHTSTDSRSIHIEGSIKPGSSQQPYTVVWQQDMSFNNENQVHNVTSSTRQQASGHSTSTHNGQPFLSNEFEFDLDLMSQGREYSLSHTYDQRLSLGQMASHTYKEPTSQSITVSQQASARNVVKNGVLSDGQGQTTTSYSYEDSDSYSFGRENTCANQAVTSDTVTGSLRQYAGPVQ